jgi:hypothetical protein
MSEEEIRWGRIAIDESFGQNSDAIVAAAEESFDGFDGEGDDLAVFYRAIAEAREDGPDAIGEDCGIERRWKEQEYVTAAREADYI